MFHNLFFGHPLSQLLRGLLSVIYDLFYFTIHSINMTNPIQPIYSHKLMYT